MFAACLLATSLVVGSGFAYAAPGAPDGAVEGADPSLLQPEIALRNYQQQADLQARTLLHSEDNTVIHAELPATSQKGEFELMRSYSAEPRSLHYASIKFEGDGFIKSNVIVKVLQSEVDQVEKGDREATALNERNYQFSYKGVEMLNGKKVHVFKVKPRKKASGLFKGKLFLDAQTGRMRRIEGSVVKTPSFFLRRIDFVQDFAEVDGFTVPTELHSIARAHIIGRAVVSIVHRGYHLTTAGQAQTNGFTGTETAATMDQAGSR
ncbi:MAG TPA: hypothetical protein VF786_08870 [Terriglobales bacterium]